MSEFKRLFFAVIYLAMSPLCAFAADEEAAESEVESAETEKSAMLRTQGTIVGYQSLSVAGQEIDATFIDETLGERHGAVILIHDIDQGIDSNDIISVLRHSLPESGWSTLTLAVDYPYQTNILLSASLEAGDEQIELDVIDADAPASNESETSTNTDSEQAAKDTEQKAEEKTLPPVPNQQRLEAALAFLQAKDINDIVLLGHGQGGVLAVKLLAEVTSPVMGLILASTPELEQNEPFRMMEQPILELMGDRDIASVVAAVKQRKVLMKRNQRLAYSQRKIIGGDHAFYGLEDQVTIAIRGWLKSNYIEPKQDDE